MLDRPERAVIKYISKIDTDFVSANIFEYQKQKKYKPLKVKHEVLEQIFHGDSLLEEYFKELYI